MPFRAARTIVSSKAGLHGGVSASGPVGVMDVGQEGGEGVVERGKAWAIGAGSAGEVSSGTGRAGDVGPSSSVDMGVSESAPEAPLWRSRIRDLQAPLPFDLVREEIGEGF
jgi:hypothetical protein